jgi:hypothetical protein
MFAAVDAYLKGVPPHKIVGGTVVSSALLLAGAAFCGFFVRATPY